MEINPSEVTKILKEQIRAKFNCRTDNTDW